MGASKPSPRPSVQVSQHHLTPSDPMQPDDAMDLDEPAQETPQADDERPATGSDSMDWYSSQPSPSESGEVARSPKRHAGTF